jgi:hypothetical protein
MKMKKLYKLILPALVIITLLFNYSCDPFDDIYLTMAMELSFNTSGSSSQIFLPAQICLDSLEDYKDNKGNLEEILYISTAYITLNATAGLQGDNLKLTVYKDDMTSILFQYTQVHFAPNDYKDHPLEIVLTEQEKTNINNYLKNPEVSKCFNATFELSNVTSASQNYTLNSKMEFLTQLKVKP